MWPFKPPKQPIDALAAELLDRLTHVEKVAKRLCDDVDELDNRYTKMRGLIYAKKLHKQPLAEEEPGEQTTAPQQTSDTSKMSRAELKAYLTRSGRFMPGLPPKHQE